MENIEHAAHAFRHDLYRSWLESQLPLAGWHHDAFNQLIVIFARWPRLAKQLRPELELSPRAALISHLLIYYGIDDEPTHSPDQAGRPTTDLFSFDGHHWFEADDPFADDESDAADVQQRGHEDDAPASVPPATDPDANSTRAQSQAVE